MDHGMDAVIAYLRNRKPELTRLDPDQDLIDSRILDSLAFVEILVLLEELTGTVVDMDLVTRDHLRTLRAIEERFFRRGVARAA